MKPIDVRIEQINAALSQRSGYESDGLKMAIAGLARDFRGLGEACARLQGFSLLTGYWFVHLKINSMLINNILVKISFMIYFSVLLIYFLIIHMSLYLF